MTTVNEAKNGRAKSAMAEELAAGVRFISANQKITFTCYRKMILPIDGFLFWVNLGIPHPSQEDPPYQITV
jgi:hypothetical protein